MAVPIIFFHYGNPAYLKYSLKQAKFFNPNSEIYLLGNKKNNRYPFVNHILASKYEEATLPFRKIYKHRSVNDYEYELNCFLRWFYINAFCRDNNIGPFIYLDSDVLLYEDISKMQSVFEHAAIANTCDTTGVPAFTYFNGPASLHSFCDFLLHSYTNNDAIKNLDILNTPFVDDPAIMGGISDMTLFHLYFQEHAADTMKINFINPDLAIDICINNPDGFEMANGIKKISWHGGAPYGTWSANGKQIRFASLHYLGKSKNLIYKHYLAGGYSWQQFLDKLELKLRFKKIKRSIKRLFK